jgi:hypothetical protein
MTLSTKKQPLLTPEQLSVIRRGLQTTDRASQIKRKATPREEFEKLFRRGPAVTPVAG